MCKRDKNGFMIIFSDEDLQLAKIKGEVSISEECKCCGRQVVVPIDRVGMTCYERKYFKVYSI